MYDMCEGACFSSVPLLPFPVCKFLFQTLPMHHHLPAYAYMHPFHLGLRINRLYIERKHIAMETILKKEERDGG